MQSYPKSERNISTRSAKPRKRKFHGNQHCNNDEENTEPQSTSAKKLSTADEDDVHYSALRGYRLIEFFTVFTALSDILICRDCKLPVKFEESGNRGLGFKIVVICKCGLRNIFSGPLINNGYEVNRRIVFVMRLLGVAREGINLFCNMMDICNGLSESTYNAIVLLLHTTTQSLFKASCVKAVDEEKSENEKHERPILNLKVSGDGTWKKRGFKSMYGVTTLIGYYSGKVIDLVVKSSFCAACARWKNKTDTEEYRQWFEEHEPNCQENHKGSSGAIEVEAVKEMFSRSEELFGVKYGNYIGDGDSKTFKGILDLNPYGDEFQVVKSECIGHVQKRMGTRLRKTRTDNHLGGRGKLTEALIKKLSLYYGLAIRRNVNSAKDMKDAIMATYYHMCSTDDKPRHEYCPSGSDSWCKWRKAEALGENPKEIKHPAPLHPDVQTHIKPIFEDLSRDDLLERCLGGHTQNANECYNSTVWRLCPKHLNSGLKIVEMSAFISAGLFNDGLNFILRVMNSMQIIIGRQCMSYREKIDDQRVSRENRRSSLTTKQARQACLQELTKKNKFYERTEGLLYGPGIAD
ncbi:uncharacterized protein LOC141535751 [Cotesia typhae]|uniref:uncharacterized protein LOC141535751 n=1 Tax=Cotesia typhae TaxID=2053667 RepID=UPI003D69C53C